MICACWLTAQFVSHSHLDEVAGGLCSSVDGMVSFPFLSQGDGVEDFVSIHWWAKFTTPLHAVGGRWAVLIKWMAWFLSHSHLRGTGWRFLCQSIGGKIHPPLHAVGSREAEWRILCPSFGGQNFPHLCVLV
ncbi:hypothetical protein BS47DRAFT_1052822 [Hydnum rufescens UP504]|uniref:Uncharacterized protein n=1 Tax=Hydnum rufescens UP504 TaxID=1448309 RepID=A0A9P6AW64_9AGAM|nr:hypothetical protein BS47DRAFT_1052822 [Hydnum rufescens UP504]